MRLGKVIGNVWATRKEEGLQGVKITCHSTGRCIREIQSGRILLLLTVSALE